MTDTPHCSRTSAALYAYPSSRACRDGVSSCRGGTPAAEAASRDRVSASRPGSRREDRSRRQRPDGWLTAGLVRAVAGGIVAGGIGASGVLFADHGVRARWQALVASHGVPSASATLPVGDEAVAMALVRSALVSLNDANRSGNYDVLRALAAPEFAARNPAQALAATFGAFARAGVDLSAVTILPAVLDRPPARDRDGLLQVAGRFEGAALRLAFNLAFKAHSGRWRIHTLGLRTEPVVAPTARVGTVPPASRG